MRHALVLAALAVAGCSGPASRRDPTSSAPPGSTSTPPGTATTPEDPPAPEVPCSGADEDRDGLPGFDDACIRDAPDARLRSPAGGGCCQRWAIVPDQDGDGYDDALLELLGMENPYGEATAWLMRADTTGRADEIAFASFTSAAAPFQAGLRVAGELDEVPGADVWIRGHLYSAPQGDLDDDDAIADLGDAPPLVDVRDFDGDGIDDLLLEGSFETGSYHSGGYDRWSEVSLSYGPFAGPVDAFDLVASAGLPGTALFEREDTPAIRVYQGSGLDRAPAVVLLPDGSEVARFDEGDVRSTPDMDGDAIPDAVVSRYNPKTNVSVQLLLAGPFEGTVDADTAPLIASWESDDVRFLPDLDGDRVGEAWVNEYTVGARILAPATGPQTADDLAASERFFTPYIVNEVPSGGPFVGELGGGPEADLAFGIIAPHTFEWNTAMYVYRAPLY